MLQFKLVAVLMMASVAYFQNTDRPPWYTGCVNTNECGAKRCCVLGGNPNPTASCQDEPEEGGVCRPNNEPINTTVVYPNGDRVTLTNVYFILCNCAGGSTCIAATCQKNVLQVQP